MRQDCICMGTITENAQQQFHIVANTETQNMICFCHHFVAGNVYWDISNMTFAPLDMYNDFPRAKLIRFSHPSVHVSSSIYLEDKETQFWMIPSRTVGLFYRICALLFVFWLLWNVSQWSISGFEIDITYKRTNGQHHSFRTLHNSFEENFV